VCVSVTLRYCIKANKPSLKGAWLWSRDLFKFLVPPTISPERLKLETSNFVQLLSRWQFSIGITNCPSKGRGHGHMTSLNFRKISEISDNISETVQDIDIVTMEDK